MDEKEVKRCIFHIPNHLDFNIKSGSQIRPLKMLQAFRDNGYEVDYIMGYGKERKCQIKKIKEKIRRNVKYDFIYSESSSMPTLLTEKNHFPRYPFLDFGFFRFCKKNGIKIGLFYRDIYWKFPVYREVNIIKRMFSIPLYRYDLKQYDRIVDMLYLPSLLMNEYVGRSLPVAELPPGCEINMNQIEKKMKNSQLNLFYVGGIGELYDLKKLFRVIQKMDKIQLTVCCRENEWKENCEKYAPYMCESIHIIHEAGEKLKPYYNEADICMLFFQSDEYRKFAMPIKLFEYIENNLPIIATSGTAAGDFVNKEGIGWTIDYQEECLLNLLNDIQNNRAQLLERKEQVRKAALENTWRKRAKKVINDLNKEYNMG